MTRFPGGFRWGVATSAYQIEGAVAADGRGPSIWDVFSHTPGAIDDGTNGDVACEHYWRYREDVEIIAALGVQDYRFSVAWPRVQPAGSGPYNAAGLDFYSRLVDALLENGIRPLVTLYHWDLPAALQELGGWRVRETADRFAEYAGVVAAALGDRVPSFTTLNEPWCSSFLGYASGDHAPGEREDPNAYLTAHHLLLAHGRAAAAVRAASPAAEVSITLNLAKVRPVSEEEPDVTAARRAEVTQNQTFLGPVLHGELAAELVAATTGVTDWGFVRDGDLAEIHAPIEFLGVNYYRPDYVGADPDPDGEKRTWPGLPDVFQHASPGPHTAMGWQVDPASLTDLLVELARDYRQVPLVITENGSSYTDDVAGDGRVHDRERTAYLRAHVAAVADAITAGVDIRGYFAWTLLDNFEWGWGYAQRFGIVHVDYATQQRTLKDSAYTYREIIAAHGLD